MTKQSSMENTNSEERTIPKAERWSGVLKKKESPATHFNILLKINSYAIADNIYWPDYTHQIINLIW